MLSNHDLRQKQRGFSLVELLVALGLSILVSGVVVSLYIEIGKNFKFDERYASMQENGRFALQLITVDLSMADFWGRVISTSTIATELTETASSCEEGVGLFNASTSILVNDYHPDTPTLQFTVCSAVADVRYGSASMLVIKRVLGEPTAEVFKDSGDSDNDGDSTEIISNGVDALTAGTVYLRANTTTGSLIDSASPSNGPDTGESDWEFRPSFYFVRDFLETADDGIPSLCRMQLEGSSFGDPQCLAEGIEDIHIQFGIDSDDDGFANLYASAPTTAQLEGAVTARIFVLVRSREAEPFYTNDKTYTLGDVTLGPFNDAFLRRAYTSTVVLRNTVGRNLIE